MRVWGASVVLILVTVLAACGSDDGGTGEVSVTDAAGDVPDEGGFEVSLRMRAQDGELAAFEGGGFIAEGVWAGDDVRYDGGLDLAPANSELTPAQELAYRSDVEARLVDDLLYLRSAAFGEGFVSADVSELAVGTVVAPVVVVDRSGVWQPVELFPLLAEAGDMQEVDRLELDGTVVTRFRGEIAGDLDAARGAVGLDIDGDGRAVVDAFVDEDGSIVRLEAEVDVGFLIAHVVGPGVSAPAALRIDFVGGGGISIEAPDDARDVTDALT